MRKILFHFSGIYKREYRIRDVICSYSSKLNLPYYIMEDAAGIISKLIEKNKRKPILDNIIAASLLVACRRRNLFKGIDEISEKIGVSKGEIFDGLKYIYETLNIKFSYSIENSVIYFITKIVTNLDLPMNVQNDSVALIRNYLKKKNDGSSPKVIAASAVYLVAKKNNFPATQKKIAEVVNTSEVSIRHFYRKLMEFEKNIKNNEM